MSGAEHGPGRGVQYSATRGEGAPARTSTGCDADESPSVIEWCGAAAIEVERYRPPRMVARRLSCRAPSGRELSIVLLGDVVVAPEMACREPRLGWLELEGVPRLSMDLAQRLERAMDGLWIGSWPFSAPLERWNEAAEVYPCLAVATDDDTATSELPSSDLSVQKQDVAMGLRTEQSRDWLGLMAGDRLQSESGGVVELFIGIRRALGLIACGLALAASVYYVLGTAGWLW